MQDMRSHPPTGVHNLVEFSRTMPLARRVAAVSNGGNDVIVWIGATSTTPLFGSGPPCYIFNSDGELVKWTSETGEGGEIDGLCQRAWRADPISVDEAIRRSRQ